jgi:hypothetical protein
MFQWLRTRRARRLLSDDLIERWIAGQDDLPREIVLERVSQNPDAAAYFLRERQTRLANSGQVDRFLRMVDWLWTGENPPIEAILQLLYPFLEDSAPESARSSAIKTVACLRHPSAIPHLLRCFGTETEDLDTRFLQGALGDLKVHAAIPRLVKNARIQKSAWVRESACEALGKIGGPEVVGHLRDLFTHERHDAVRLEAAIGLARNGETDVLEHLEQAFVGGEVDLSRDVADYWLEGGRIEVLDRILVRMRPDPKEWGRWVSMLQRHFPQMPQLEFDLLSAPPFGKYKPRVVHGSLRWLEKHRPSLRWDAELEKFVTPHLPLPAKKGVPRSG